MSNTPRFCIGNASSKAHAARGTEKKTPHPHQSPPSLHTNHTQNGLFFRTSPFPSPPLPPLSSSVTLSMTTMTTITTLFLLLLLLRGTHAAISLSSRTSTSITVTFTTGDAPCCLSDFRVCRGSSNCQAGTGTRTFSGLTPGQSYTFYGSGRDINNCGKRMRAARGGREGMGGGWWSEGEGEGEGWSGGDDEKEDIAVSDAAARRWRARRFMDNVLSLQQQQQQQQQHLFHFRL